MTEKIFEILTDKDIILQNNETHEWELTRESLRKYPLSNDGVSSFACREIDGDIVYAMNTGHTIRVFRCRCHACNNICMVFEGTSMQLCYDVPDLLD